VRKTHALHVSADKPMPSVISDVAMYGECAPNGEAAANRHAAGPSMPATCARARVCVCVWWQEAPQAYVLRRQPRTSMEEVAHASVRHTHVTQSASGTGPMHVAHSMLAHLHQHAHIAHSPLAACDEVVGKQTSARANGRL
jgi:hypothetical protein